MAFVKDVLDELMAVFPSTFIHLGGDEAVKDQWERAPQVQAQMRGLGIKTENGLQSWMIDQLGSYLAQHGRRLIGWDEILEGGLPASASVMSWRGEAGAVDAANAGHDVVLSPAPNLYLDNLQSDRGDAPPGRIAIQTLEAVYRYDPMPKGIDAQKAAHVLGAQANAWSEYIVTPWQMQHKIFPRIGALAESVWSDPQAAKDYPGFLARLDPQMRRWRAAGLEVADSALAVDFKLVGTRSAALDAAFNGKRVGVTLATQAPYGTIRYTLDGSAPTARAGLCRAAQRGAGHGDCRRRFRRRWRGAVGPAPVRGDARCLADHGQQRPLGLPARRAGPARAAQCRCPDQWPGVQRQHLRCLRGR
jgi:hexosaminidase